MALSHYHLLGQHFLQNLFRGLTDRPPKYPEKGPRVFDEQLPVITDGDLQQLQGQIPELTTFLENSLTNVSMKEEIGRASFWQDKEFDDLSTAQFQMFLGAKTSGSVLEKKLNSSLEMSTSQKATEMSIDASKQIEWTCQEEKTTVQDHVPVHEATKVTSEILQEIDECVKDSNVNERRKSNSDTSSEKSSALEDSDLIFRSAHDDYVTVFGADLVANADDANAQPVGERQEDCSALLDDASQTPTLARSMTQSTDHSSQTEQGSEGGLQLHVSGVEEPLRKGSKILEEKLMQDNKQQQARNELAKKIEQLENELRTAQSTLENEFSQRERLQQGHAKVKDCVKKEFEVIRQNLMECKQVTIDLTSCVNRDVMAMMVSFQEKGEFYRNALIESTVNQNGEEFERKLAQLGAQFEKERTAFFELNSKLELENGRLRDDLKRYETDRERREAQYKEEVDNLSLVIKEYKSKIEEQEGTAVKMQGNKSRYEEDQQRRFNAIMMKLKQEKESALSQAQEKIKELTKCMEELEKDVKCLEMEKDKLSEECQQSQDAFCGREQELLNGE